MGWFPFAYESLIESSFPIEETLVLTIFFLFSQFFGLLGNIFATTPGIIYYYHLLMGIIATKGFGLWLLAIIFGIGGGYTLFVFKTHYKRTELENSKKKIHDEDFIETEKLIDN